MSDREEIPTLAALRARRAEILHIAERRGARNVRVFGSVARGDAGVESDVDLLVEMEPGRTVLDLSELILDLQESLGRNVDVVESQRLTPDAGQILHEAIAL